MMREAGRSSGADSRVQHDATLRRWHEMMSGASAFTRVNRERRPSGQWMEYDVRSRTAVSLIDLSGHFQMNAIIMIF
jgi:hypothetical protein